MIRKAFTMNIHAGAADEYKRRHDELWPEMAQVLKAHGVHNYSIHLQGTALFSYVEIKDEASWNSLADEPVIRKWWDHMADIMETNPDNSPAVKYMSEVFYMD